MIEGNVIANISTEYIPNVLLEIGNLANGLQALGIIIVVVLVFQIISLIVNVRRQILLQGIRRDLFKIKKKLGLVKKTKKKSK